MAQAPTAATRRSESDAAASLTFADFCDKHVRFCYIMSGKKFTRDEEVKLVEFVAYNECLCHRSNEDYKDTETQRTAYEKKYPGIWRKRAVSYKRD